MCSGCFSSLAKPFPLNSGEGTFAVFTKAKVYDIEQAWATVAHF
jgi:hypothetical protein